MNLFRLNILIAAGGSLALLFGAFAFQHIGGLAPCHLCLLQRWPHAAAILIGTAALALGNRMLGWLGAAAALTTAGIGGYHTGVERGWWEGPTTCTSGGATSLSADDFFEKVINDPLIRCDEVAWQMLGLSMASGNMLVSLILVIFWVRAARS